MALAPESKPLKVVLLGYGCLGLNILQGLLKCPHVQIVGVFRWSKRKGKKWEGSDDDEREFGRLIERHRLHQIRCPGANSYEMVAVLKALEPDVVMMATWGEILKQHVLALPGIRFINCHPSLLPAHRGANPYISVLCCDEPETGVTFHGVNEAIDDGPILLQDTLPVGRKDTGGDLQRKCGLLAGQMIGPLFSLLKAKPDYAGTPQNPEAASYYPKMEIAWGNILWDEDPHQVCCWVRAYLPWMESYSFVDTPFAFAKALMVTIKQLRTEPPETDTPADVLPGTILAIDSHAIWVASAHPNQVFVIENYGLFAGYKALELGVLPRGLSGLLGPWLIRPGKRFYDGAQPTEPSTQVETAASAQQEG